MVLFGLAMLTHCGAPPERSTASVASPPTAPVTLACRPRPPSTIGLGVAHVAGTYAVRHQASESFLQAGALRARELGARTLKLFLTPEFRTKYPQAWPEGIGSLAALADSQAFRDVFDQPFDTFVLTTYSFSMGSGDPWRGREVDGLLSAEAQELDELVTLLSTRYAGSGKTFVLQTWEGDWALFGNYDPSTIAPADRIERMSKWLSSRHQAIAVARDREARPGVAIADAIEVNRVLDVGVGPRVISAVVPNACADLISYSAWEALEGASADVLETRLTTALATIRQFAPAGSAVMLGELGFAENENEVAPAAELIERTLAVAKKNDVRGAVYWQIFDNECSAQNGCRGFWVMRPDGSLSGAGQSLSAHWANGS